MKKIKPLLLLSGALLLGGSPAAHASCSAEPMIGSVCVVAFTFCPRGYLPADGRIVSINSHVALFALIGNTFGGNGQNTFGIPDLRGRSPVGVGTGPGLGTIDRGDVGGAESVQLSVAQMPPHTHSAQVRGTAGAGNTDSPSGAVPAKLARSNIYSNSGASDAAMNSSAVSIGTSGSGQPVAIRNPYLGLLHCIATDGLFPTRN